MPASDLSLLIEAAEAAGDIARRYFNATPRIWEKEEGQGPVTEADMEIDRHLRENLLTERPSYGWLSEETEDDQDRLNRDKVFILDPIDGTRAFIEGQKLFGTALAVAEAGRVTAAVVHMPMLERTYHAELGGAAMLNGQPISAADAPDTTDARILTTRQTMQPEHWKEDVPGFSRHFRPSLAYRTCLTAAGEFDAMITLRPVWEWDVAAGALIMEAAGAKVTDRAGFDARFNNPHPQLKGMVAAGPALHSNILAKLVY